MIYTDEWKAYDGLDGKKEYEHKSIYHAEKAYVVATSTRTRLKASGRS